MPLAVESLATAVRCCDWAGAASEPVRFFHGNSLFGTGTLTVTGIPELATWMLMGVGLLLGAQRLRRKG